MSFWNKEQPFGLPKGTIRALLVVLFGVAVVFPIFKFAVYEQDIPQSVKEVMLVLVGGLQSIIAKYFDIRKDDDKLMAGTVERKEIRAEEEVKNG